MRSISSRISRLTGSAALITVAFGLWLSPIAARDDDNSSSSHSQNADQQYSNQQDDDQSNVRSSSSRESSSDNIQSRSQRGQNHHSALGVSLSEDSAGNLFVRRVIQGSPAEDAGLRPGDEILTVDGQRVMHTNALKRALAMSNDDDVILGVLRKGRHQEMNVTLGDADDVFGQGNQQSSQGNRQNGQGNRQNGQQYGQGNQGQQYAQNDGRSTRRNNSYSGNNRRNYHQGAALGIALDHGPRSGVWITDVFQNSPADDAGLRAGDQITAIDGQQVDSAEDVINVISQKRPDEQISLDVDRNGREKTIKAQLVRHDELAARMGQMQQSRRNTRGDTSRDGGSSGSSDRGNDSNSDDDSDSDRNK